MNKNVYDFNLTHTPSMPTFVLCNRGKEKLGCVNVVCDFQPSFNLKSADEFTVTVNKYSDVNICNLWDKIKDLKLIYIPEYDEYYEITVSTSESDSTLKTITGISLCESELSNIYLYDIEINTEADILRDDYVEPTIIYNKEKPENSLLNRILYKAPHYHVKHVDESVAKLQRSFSIDGESIYDFLTTTLSEEINCLVLFDSSDRSISIYDLEQSCKDCGYRDEFEKTCPKCGSNNIYSGYGNDTGIFISRDNLSQEMNLSCRKDDIKNCFKVQAGDNLMTSTVAACNPSGTPYFYYFSEDIKENMSDSLKESLKSYNELYDSKLGEYQKIMADIYDYIDKIAYETSEKMPKQEVIDTTAKDEIKKLTSENIGYVAVEDIKKASATTVNSVVLSVAKTLVFRGYSTTIVNSEYNKETHIWKGRFQVKSRIDDEDIATSDSDIILTIGDDYIKFVEQKIKKSLSSENDISSVLDPKLTLEQLKTELKKYCLNRLSSFADAYQSCIDILIQLGLSEETSEHYESFYLVWYEKLLAIQDEIVVVEEKIKKYNSTLDELEKRRDKINILLDIRKFMGDKIWTEYRSHIREKLYTNDNYISDGLKNSEMFEKAKELIEVAKKDLRKASTFQYTLSGTMSNLLTLEEFEPLHDSFKLGNWIRILIDDTIYKLRITSFTPSFDDFSQMNVEFENDLRKVGSTKNVSQLVRQTKILTQKYPKTERASSKGMLGYETIKNWENNGIDASKINIDSSKGSVKFNGNGVLGRQYDDLLDQYSDTQFKIIGDTIVYTNDNWRSTKPLISNVSMEVYGVSADIITEGSNISKSQIVDSSINNNKGDFRLYANGRCDAKDFHMTGGDININNKFIVSETGDVSGEMSDVSVVFSGNDIKELIVSGDSFSSIMLKINTWLKSLGNSAFANIKNNATTNEEGYVLDARVGKTLKSEIDEKMNGSSFVIEFTTGNSMNTDLTYPLPSIITKDNSSILSVLIKDSYLGWIDAFQSQKMVSYYPGHYRLLSDTAYNKNAKIILYKYE